MRAPRLEIRLLGDVEVRAAGVPFALAQPRKTLSVLAFLLLNRAAPISRDFLTYQIWPDEEEETARNRLRATLHDLQRILPEPHEAWIDVGPGTLMWNRAAGVWLDVEAFESAAADASRLREAAGLYRGELLPALKDEWIVVPRERLKHRYLRVLGDLSSHARRQQAYPQALELANKLLVLDPWREDIVRRTMSLHFESGDRVAALAEYRRFAGRLRAEMGVEPMPETQALMESIAGAIHLSEGSAHAALPFVGRAGELARARDAWSRALAGRGQVVAVGGEAGVGKTRFVQEISSEAEEHGARILRGATGRPESFPYQSFAEALRGSLPLFAALQLPPRIFAALATLVPQLRERIGTLPDLPPLDPQRERERLVDALGSALELLAKPRPIVLVLEDLQSAGEATLEALKTIVRRLSGTHSLVVVTYRDEETPRSHPIRRYMREETQSRETITLGPLDDVAAGDLIRARRGAEAMPAAAAMLQRAGGNPLFLVLLLQDARDESALPADIRGLVASRLAALSPDAIAFAQTAALTGERFSLDVLREALEWDDGRTFGALGELIDRRIVRERGGRGLLPHAFVHQLVQEVVVDAAPQTERGTRHRHIAAAFDRLFGERPGEFSAETAGHYERGAQPALAAERYHAAALHALALGAVDDARGYVERALALVEVTRSRAEFLFTRLRVGERGDPVDEQRLDELRRLARELGDGDLECRALVDRVRALNERGESVASIREAIEALRSRAATHAGGLRWLATCDYYEAGLQSVTLDEACDSARRAFEAFLALGDDGAASRAAGMLAFQCADARRIPEACQARDEALERASLAGTYESLVRAQGAAFTVALYSSDVHAMETAGERWLALATEAGDLRERALALGQKAGGFFSAGQLGRALSALDGADIMYERLDVQRNRAGVANNRGVVLCAIGLFEAAVAELQRACAMHRKQENRRWRGEALATSALCRIAMDDLVCAQLESVEAQQLAHEAHDAPTAATALECLAEIERLRGNASAGLRHLEAALALRDSIGDDACATHVAIAAAHVALGNADAASHALAQVPDDDRAPFAGALIWPERLAWNAALVSRALGDAESAERWQTRARTLLDVRRASLSDDAQRRAYDAMLWSGAILEAARKSPR